MDIDIDFIDRSEALRVFKHVIASRRNPDGNLVPHNTGIYVQNIPATLLNNLSTIDYKEAEERGYFKIDFLNVGVYTEVKDRAHLKTLMEIEPIWSLLQEDEFTDLLFHLNGHGDILRKTCPTSVEQLAAVLAMIRPAKRYLIGKTWTEIMAEVWKRPTNNDYYFKKSHAIAYAHAIVVQMNLIVEIFMQGKRISL